MCRGCRGEHRSPAETLRPGQTSGSMTSIDPYIAGADSISARELCRCRTRARASTARPYNAPVLHLFKECIRVGRVELLVRPHQGDKVLRLTQVDDIVGAAGQHLHGLRLVAPDLKFQHLIAANAALLNQAVLCQCWPFVMPGLDTFTLNWPQCSVFSSSVKLPRASSFCFKSKRTLPFGR